MRKHRQQAGRAGPRRALASRQRWVPNSIVGDMLSRSATVAAECKSLTDMSSGLVRSMPNVSQGQA